MKKLSLYLALIGVNLVYASVCIFTKSAAGCTFMSWPYILWMAGAVGVLGVYAVLWQQIIRRLDIGVAYMFKGTSLIFTLLISALMWGEHITMANLIGAAVIITGITLFARS